MAALASLRPRASRHDTSVDRVCRPPRPCPCPSRRRWLVIRLGVALSVTPRRYQPAGVYWTRVGHQLTDLLGDLSQRPDVCRGMCKLRIVARMDFRAGPPTKPLMLLILKAALAAFAALLELQTCLWASTGVSKPPEKSGNICITVLARPRLSSYIYWTNIGHVRIPPSEGCKGGNQWPAPSSIRT